MRFHAVFVLSNLIAALVSAADTPATLIIEGRIWTADTRRPWAEAVAILDGRVVAVGDREQVRSHQGETSRVIRVAGGLALPGLIDSHIHLIDGGLRLSSVQLRDASTRDEFVRRIAGFVKQQDRGAWVTGGDWDHTLWGGELPSRDWIDAVTPDNPVWINRLDGHMSLANTAAMRAANVPDDVKDVPGGEIVRDKSGRPTGILKDNALSLIDRAQPDPTLQQRYEAALAAMDFLVARGVTSVHHLGTWSDVEVFRLVERKSPMKVRVYACTPLDQWERLSKEVEARGRGNDWLRIGGLKGYVDGSLGSHTAAFLEPFSDAPADRGLFVNTEEDLQRWTTAADRAELQVVVHAIGDRAIRAQLDVFERVAVLNGPRDRRFRIEHAQHIHPNDLPRFAKLNVIASMQPYHAIDDGRWAERAIGPLRSETSYAFRSLLDTNARLAFGSDWYVAPPTPLEGMYAAVTRRTLDGKNPQGWVPQQRISVEESLRAYTINAAYAGFSDTRIGSIEIGKLADIVVLDRNPFNVTANELADITVRLTIVGGKIVYDSSTEPRSHN
jgi:predicted amidohydrolase YtcJ